VVLLAEGCHGGAIGSGKVAEELRAVGQRWTVAGGSAGKGAGIPLGAPTTRRSPVGAPKNVIDVYWGPQEGGSDTMLNILYRAEEGEREKRESGSQQWTTLYYIVI
jgi:hypothetical protein